MLLYSREDAEKPALKLLNMLAQLIIILLTNSTKYEKRRRKAAKTNSEHKQKIETASG